MAVFEVEPQTIVIGNITLTLGYNVNDPSQCILLASASASQAQNTVVFNRHGLPKGAAAATVAADITNVNPSVTLGSIGNVF